MDQKEWLATWEVCERWGKTEDEITDLVMDGKLKAYNDNKQGPLPLKQVIQRHRVIHPGLTDSNRFGGFAKKTKQAQEVIDISRDKIKQVMGYFKYDNVRLLEYEGIIKLPEKPEEEPATLRPGAIDDPVKYVLGRRKEGAKDAIIAVEMDNFGFSQFKIGQTLTEEKGITVTVGAYKMRGKRLINKGRTLKKVTK